MTESARWQLWRQDDNGVRFFMASFADREGAERRLAELESGVPHKQLYWIAPAEAGGSRVSGREQ